jgi:phenylpropionate dioxygenase-like ring-hydroxylating dioxygenase large terminal subunit
VDLSREYNRAVELVLAHVQQGTTDQAESVMTVRAGDYTDPKIWSREMDLLFGRLPILAALSVELPKPGDFKSMDYIGKPLLITRLKDGGVRAMLNVCTHRATVIVKEGAGNATRFTCPYHGWTYGNDGRLVGVSEAKKFGEIDKESHGLTVLPSYERAGLIFVVLTPGVEPDFAKFLGGMLDEIEPLGFDKWHYNGHRDIHGANWKVAYDGYLEGYHFATAHKETVWPRTFSNVMHFAAHGPHLRICFPHLSIVEKLRNVPASEWFKQENNGYDFVRTLFPNVSIFVAPEMTQIAQLMPGPTPDRNTTRLYYLSPAKPDNERAQADLDRMCTFFGNVTYEEDYLLGMQVQRGLESGAIRNVVFGKNERGNQLFHNYVNYYLSQDSNAPTPRL